MKMGLGRKSKIIINVSLIISLIVFLYFALPYCVSGVIAKIIYSRYLEPELYILPIEKKIADIENHRQNNYKINYANFEIKLPTNSIRKICSSTDKKLNSYNIKDDKGINIETHSINKDEDDDAFIGMHLKNKDAFEMYSKMFSVTPDQINFFSVNSREKFIKKSSFLIIKSGRKFDLISRGGFYKFNTSNVNGFQFGDPNNTEKQVKVIIFSKKGDRFELSFVGFSQGEIDYTLASIRFRENEGQQRPIK
jgi:hypothetical protein